MRLIGAGLPRTGTLSQKVALEMLGLRCHHMVEVLADLDQATQWQRAIDGDLCPTEILQGFDAMVDWPGSFFYRDLIEKYPDAKVLLSVRDGDAWAKSMNDTVWGVLHGDKLMTHMSRARVSVDPQWANFIEMCSGLQRETGIPGEGGTLADLSAVMDRWVDEVKQTVPSDRLLVWKVTDGWEPLCELLELPVPDVAFPNVNDSKEFGERIVNGALAVIQQKASEAMTGGPEGKVAAKS